jgi:hypothetical protein
MNKLYMYRDENDAMWVGNININDPNVAARLPFRWIVNNKRANRNEIRCEWLAVRHTRYDLLEKSSLLYLDADKI